MGSTTQHKTVFTSQELEALDLALAGALATAKELGLRQDVLERALRRRIFVIASEGVTDPEELCGRTLKSMNLDKIATY